MKWQTGVSFKWREGVNLSGFSSVAKLNAEQTKLSQLPNIYFSLGYGRSFGRSINPTTNDFDNSSYDYTGMNGSGSVLLFGWFQKRNTIARSNLLHQASEADVDQIQNDVSLNVVTGYLRILLAQEQISISNDALAVSKQKTDQTAQLLEAGRSNGLDMAQMRTQLTTDSTLYFKALLDYHQAVIDLKAILNLQLETPFAPAPVAQEDIPLQNLYTLTPQEVFQVAANRLGGIRSSVLKVKGAEKDVQIAKSNLYPQLSLSASSGSNYSSNYYQYLSNGDEVLMPWGKQLRNNFSQSISLNINIPVFNGLSARYTIKQARLALQNVRLQEQETESELKQSVFKAWNDAQTALQTYNATRSAAATAATGLYFAQQRYDKGLINAADFLTAQNTNFQAQSNEASAKYDLIFKIKVIEYYFNGANY
ncbi:TolC family protein [Arachidicoccus sp.]|uniref:TolC family protein n=1 Tax=Arachidicoccus sp. TaxID=1872624 RepID=UPI003D1F7574